MASKNKQKRQDLEYQKQVSAWKNIERDFSCALVVAADYMIRNDGYTSDKVEDFMYYFLDQLCEIQDNRFYEPFETIEKEVKKLIGFTPREFLDEHIKES